MNLDSPAKMAWNWWAALESHWSPSTQKQINPSLDCSLAELEKQTLKILKVTLEYPVSRQPVRVQKL